MTTTYQIDGDAIVRTYNAGTTYQEHEVAAYCNDPVKALELMVRAWELNDARKYTASARMIARLEALPGFEWAKGEE